MITMQEIRERYYFPRTAGSTNNRDDGYCVGGAVCLFSNLSPARFPRRRELSQVLLLINYNLNHSKADEFANDIISANDKRNFDLAWQLVDDAFTHGRC